MTYALRITIMSALLASLLGLNVWALLFGVPMVNAWEKAHGYPFGHMCDLTNSCPVR
jgi:hypothetical protein